MGEIYTFPRSARLLSPREFSSVFDQPSFKIHHPNFLILARFNQLDHPRLGLVIAKKHVRLAVNRNQIKRLTRESFRNKQHNLPAIDAIVLARRGSEKLTKTDIRQILENLWTRAAKKAQKYDTQNDRDC